MLPDFLCIGAQKAGTTWLHHNLSQHPALWLPPLKEPHYFNDYGRAPMFTRCFSRKAKGRRTRRLLLRYGLRVFAPRTRQWGWHTRYLFAPRSDAWYASLFSPDAGQLAGECTPAYCRLTEPLVAHIHRLMPRAKLIYLMRNPVERDLSQATMRFNKRVSGGIAASTQEQVLAYLEKTKGRQSDYLTNLDRWRRHYPDEQLFVGFFDQLQTDPRGLLRDVFTFLGVDASERVIPDTVHQKQNAGQYSAAFPEVVRVLANRYYDELERIHERFENEHTAHWLAYAREHL